MTDMGLTAEGLSFVFNENSKDKDNPLDLADIGNTGFFFSRLIDIEKNRKPIEDRFKKYVTVSDSVYDDSAINRLLITPLKSINAAKNALYNYESGNYIWDEEYTVPLDPFYLNRALNFIEVIESLEIDLSFVEDIYVEPSDDGTLSINITVNNKIHYFYFNEIISNNMIEIISEENYVIYETKKIPFEKIYLEKELLRVIQ